MKKYKKIICIDKAAIATERMKSAYAKTRDKAEQGYYADESSATEYAADRLSYGADRIKDEGIHQFNKQGQKAVKETRENIGKSMLNTIPVLTKSKAARPMMFWKCRAVVRSGKRCLQFIL